MKLVILEYLASLRERDELDSLLPDLLSQMGLEVFSKPGMGNRQYGVDVAAFGSIEGGKKTVYLFSVKSGDIGRKDWNAGSVQDLQPSLDEIRNVYIPTHLPTKYKDLPIEICICFGGNLKEEIRLNVTSYEKKYTTENISFSEWGGEKLSSYIGKYLLKEELLPDKCHGLLRKSLAMLDEPDISFKHFCFLIQLLSSSDFRKKKDRLTCLRQIYLCLWILYSWCRDAENIEAAYLSSEYTMLHSWSILKPHLGKKDKLSNSLAQTFSAILLLNYKIGSHLIEEKIIPHVGKLYALSNAVNSSCHIDVNIRLFDILGRISLNGLWLYWFFYKFEKNENKKKELDSEFQKSISKYYDAIKKLIINNPTLFSPYKDEQVIDITLAILFLAVNQENDSDIHTWLINMVDRIYFLFHIKGCYPCNINSYNKLLEHPDNDKVDYKEKVTQGSILYPYIAIFANIFGFEDIYKMIQKLKTDYLKHCNFQVWYIDETSEDHYYLNDQIHGATLSQVPIDKDSKEFARAIFNECNNSDNFRNLSAIRYEFWPLILIASRHYRLPVPMNYLMDYWKEEHIKEGKL